MAQFVLGELASHGVRDIVVCAGARNAPFVKLLGVGQGFRVLHFFEERAAAFFALGRARRDQRPVAVVTTSGTAAAELLPATIEAFYTGTPLVLVTADRPIHYRGRGAPQAIEQVGLFGPYTKTAYDLEASSIGTPMAICQTGPTHLNVCFSEPLIDGEVRSVDYSPNANGLDGNDVNRAISSDEKFDKVTEKTRVHDFFARAKKPLVITSGLSSSERGHVAEWLQQTGVPFFAESPSGLREVAILEPQRLRSTETFSQPNIFRKFFDSVIRLGSVPTLRLWRDLEDSLKDVPVLSVSEWPFSGLGREPQAPVRLASFLEASANWKGVMPEDLKALDRSWGARLEALLQNLPQSEPAMVRWLSEQIPAGSLVMLGNSLPIREWDLAAQTADRGLSVVANRGANGIDGLVATFLGLAQKEVENWLVLGDLSALYDLNALAFTQLAEAEKLRIVVINNGGGQIFQPMFKDKNFLNAHAFEFSKWAEMFGWDYIRQPQHLDITASRVVIELRPENSSTEIFNTELKRLSQ